MVNIPHDTLGLAILIGAGLTTVHPHPIPCAPPNSLSAQGAGIARILSYTSHGNLAIALLARDPTNLSSLAEALHSSSPDSIIETFPTDTQPLNVSSAFSALKAHRSFKGLKLKIGIFNVKHSSKKPFLEKTHEEFTKSLNDYDGGAFAFSQEFLKLLFEHHGETVLADGKGKKVTLIFTGTLSVRMLAQSLAKEYSEKGVHVVHAIANGSIKDEDGEDQRQGKTMSAEAVGRTYLWLSEQGPELWTHELDLRPAQEKF
ncbi:MAG: hypothetical protein Q9209_007687 [Squamulea sp. 1 TL-2023]